MSECLLILEALFRWFVEGSLALELPISLTIISFLRRRLTKRCWTMFGSVYDTLVS